jgi:predicted transcriptional regulator
MLSPRSQPRHKRYSARWQVRLDPETHAKLQELTKALHRKRAQILRYVMVWGLDHPQARTPNRQPPEGTHLVHMLAEPALLQQVREAAALQGDSVAAWVRQAMRQVTLEDFPASWLAGEMASRSHDSGHYQRRFMLRLDTETSHKLETLTRAFDRPAAEIIRQLIGQAKPEYFPRSWQMAVDERLGPQALQSHKKAIQPPGGS